MMHGYLEHYGGDQVQVYSAGVETHGVNPFAIGVMAEDGVLIHQHTSNHVNKYDDIQFDVVITVCDHAKEVCPIFPNAKRVVHHAFNDPSAGSGTSKDLIAAFRKTREEIKTFATDFISKIDESNS